MAAPPGAEEKAGWSNLHALRVILHVRVLLRRRHVYSRLHLAQFVNVHQLALLQLAERGRLVAHAHVLRRRGQRVGPEPRGARRRGLHLGRCRPSQHFRTPALSALVRNSLLFLSHLNTPARASAVYVVIWGEGNFYKKYVNISDIYLRYLCDISDPNKYLDSQIISRFPTNISIPNKYLDSQISRFPTDISIPNKYLDSQQISRFPTNISIHKYVDSQLTFTAATTFTATAAPRPETWWRGSPAAAGSSPRSDARLRPGSPCGS